MRRSVALKALRLNRLLKLVREQFNEDFVPVVLSRIAQQFLRTIDNCATTQLTYNSDSNLAFSTPGRECTLCPLGTEQD